MSFEHLNNYIIGIPSYRFNPSATLVALLAESKIGIDRLITIESSDVGAVRAAIVTEFLTGIKYIQSDVLVFHDQDTHASIHDVEKLVIGCSKNTPIIGSNMVYRNRDTYNWFLHDDPGHGKKNKILSSWEIRDGVIKAKHIGFGLVAIHRSALAMMNNHFGVSFKAGMQCTNIFDEYKLSEKKIPFEVIEQGFLKNKKPKGIDEQEWYRLWEEHFKPLAKFHYKHSSYDRVLPETFSFCERASELGIPIYVYLGVRPGHEQSLIRHANLPPLRPVTQAEETIIISEKNHYSSNYLLHANN